MKCIYCLKETTNLSHKCRSTIIQIPLDKKKTEILHLLENGYATNYIANNSVQLLGFTIANQHLIAFCNRHSIKRRSIKESCQSAVTKQVKRDGMELKYGKGITNASQATEVKNKKIQTNLARYGVENSFQRAEVMMKAKETMLRKYGVENPIDMPGRLSNANHTRLSKPHKVVSEYLNSINVLHTNDETCQFRKFNESMNRIYSPIPDIYIKEKNIVFEIYGDYWHMNPKKYCSTDVVRFFVGPQTGAVCWAFDAAREEHIRSQGATLVVLWESDIKHNFEYIKQLIQDTLCNN